jgi:hypothetical protein
MGPGFCDVAKMGDHPENNLAKFGYILVIKVWKKKKKKQNPFISFGTHAEAPKCAKGFESYILSIFDKKNFVKFSEILICREFA